MHAHHTHFGDVFAMDVAGMNRMSSMSGEDLLAEGESWPLPRIRARRAVDETLQQLEHALVGVDRSRHPGVSEAAWGTVVSRTRELLRSLARHH